MMMEAIGQKAVLSSTDEVIISDELGVDSGEMGEERMFDVTLDEILAEHPLDESLLEGLLEEDSLTASLASSILTQNQANPEFVEDIFGTTELSTIPAEVLDDNLWTEETHTARSKVLNKSEPFTQELIEVLDPRVVSDESTFQNLPSQGVAETGLQSILQESDLENPESFLENPESLLQTVFHQAKPPEEGTEFSEDDLQSVMQKNKNLPVQSKEDTEYSVLQKILHQVKLPEEGTEFSEDDLQTVLQTNTGQQIPIKENNSVVQGPEPVQENLEGLLQKELQAVFHQELQGNEKDATKQVAENLVKILPAEIPPAAERISPEQNLQAENLVKIMPAEILPAAEKISPEQSLQVVANTKTEKSILAAGNFKEAEEFEGGVKSKTTAGLQMTDVENLSDSAEKVPKFPSPHNLIFLMRYHHSFDNKIALEMATKTLKQMRLGGIYDHIGFGFHRYSTDRHWLVPHFEKMLYDQAMIAMAYTEAYHITGEDIFAQTANEIFTYVLRDMTASEGGFLSAEDADSEGEEGKFYVWTEQEIKEVLGENYGKEFNDIFSITTPGNYKDESSGKQTRLNIPHLNNYNSNGNNDLDSAREKLFNIREKRIHPLKDDKILTDWNGLMIAALAKAAIVLNEPGYLDAAEKAAKFVLHSISKGERSEERRVGKECRSRWSPYH